MGNASAAAPSLRPPAPLSTPTVLSRWSFGLYSAPATRPLILVGRNQGPSVNHTTKAIKYASPLRIGSYPSAPCRSGGAYSSGLVVPIRLRERVLRESVSEATSRLPPTVLRFWRLHHSWQTFSAVCFQLLVCTLLCDSVNMNGLYSTGRPFILTLSYETG